MATAPGSAVTDEALQKAAVWLRKRLETGQGLFQQQHLKKRAEYFVGEDFRAALGSDKFRKSKIFPAEFSIEDVGTRMLRGQYFMRGDLTNEDTADLEELDTFELHRKQVFVDEDDDYLLWILPPSNTELYTKTAAMLIGALFMCMIKIWPLWLKIGVWWVSLIMLICMLSLIVIRLFLAAIFTVIGFRGIWLLPNLLNDDVDFLDAFTPLFGQGINIKEYQQAQLERQAAGRRRRAKQKSKEEKDAAKKARAEKKEGKQIFDELQDSSRSWWSGLLNVCVIGVIGMFLCNWIGLFSPEMLPDFVVSQVELWKEYPSLAPPDFDAAAQAAAEAEKLKKNKKHKGPSLDEILGEDGLEGLDEEYKADSILNRVDDVGEVNDLDMPDVPDDDEDMPDVPDDEE